MIQLLMSPLAKVNNCFICYSGGLGCFRGGDQGEKRPRYDEAFLGLGVVGSVVTRRGLGLIGLFDTDSTGDMD